MSEQENSGQEEQPKTEAELAAEIAAEARADADEAEDLAEDLAEEAGQMGVDEAQAAFDKADKALVKAQKAVTKAKENVVECEAAQIAAGEVLAQVKPRPSFSEQIQSHLKSQNDKARKGKPHPIDVAGKGGPSPFQL